MKAAPLLSLFAAGVSLAATAFAQDYPPPPPPAEPPAPAEMSGSTAPSPQFQQLPPLDQLVAPVALYPDPVIALMLPAAAFPDQIQQAASDPNNPALDPSVQGLAHYPSVVQWMAANSQWTSQLGGAFANSPGDVMNAIQDLRQRARAAGTLVPSAYETISVDESGQIEIMPAQPNAIYIPSYDPSLVYWGGQSGYDGGYLGWSQPYPMGAWLSFDFDWRSHRLWQGDWYDYHRTHGGWNRPVDYARGDFRAQVRGSELWHAPSHPPPAPSGRVFSRPQIGRPTERGGADDRRAPEAPGRPRYEMRPQEQARPEGRPDARPEGQQRGQSEQRGEARPGAQRPAERQGQAPQRQAPAARPAPQEERHEERPAQQGDRDKDKQPQ